MSKFTAKFVREGLEISCGIMDWKNLEVKGDKKQTFNNVAMHLLSTGVAMDTAYIFEAKFPKGIAEILEGYLEQWEALRVKLVKFDPSAYVQFAEQFEIYPASGDPDNDPAFKGLDVEPPKFDGAGADVEEDEDAEEEVEELDESEEEEIEEGVDDEELSDEELDEELDEVLDEEFEDEVLAEEEVEEKKPAPKRGRGKK